MKHLTFLAAILVAGTAHAADLPLKAAAAPVFSWTGSYAGIAGGYGFGHSDQGDRGIPPTPPGIDVLVGDGGYPVRGGLLGGTLGRNWQQGRFVLGVEGDLSWSGIKGASGVCGPATVNPHPCGTQLDALGTFRGRLGVTAGADNTWLFYATGGLAAGSLYGWDALTPAGGRDWRAGWTGGGGVEVAFAPNWSAKLEYLHVDLGNAPAFLIAAGVTETVGLTADIVRAGINYRFDGTSAPLAASRPYVKAPPRAGNGWSGWYAGVNAGYLDGAGAIDTDASIVANSTTPGTAPAMARGALAALSTGRSGYLGGAQIGYNAMLSPLVLAGFEADIQGSWLRGNGSAATSVPTDTVFGPNTGTWLTSIAASRSLDYIGTVRGRLGTAVTPGLLLYVTGGLAYGGIRSSTSISQTTAIGGVPANAVAGSFSDNRVGYTVGGGGEVMLASNWSVKAEYLYYDLGSATYGNGRFFVDETPTNLPGIGVAGIASSSRLSFNGNIARVGLNYHLN